MEMVGMMSDAGVAVDRGATRTWGWREGKNGYEGNERTGCQGLSVNSECDPLFRQTVIYFCFT